MYKIVQSLVKICYFWQVWCYKSSWEVNLIANCSFNQHSAAQIGFGRIQWKFDRVIFGAKTLYIEVCRVASTKEKAPISENIYPPVCPHLHSTQAHFAHVCVCMFVSSFITTNKQTNNGTRTIVKVSETFQLTVAPTLDMKRWLCNAQCAWLKSILYLSSSNILTQNFWGRKCCIFLCTEIQSDEAGLSNTVDIKGIYIENLFPVFFAKSKCNFELICNLLFQNSLQINEMK